MADFYSGLWKLKDKMSSYSKVSKVTTVYKFQPFKWTEECPRRPLQNQNSPHSSIKSPKPRSGHRIVYHEGHIYSFGGFNPSLGDDASMEADQEWASNQPLFKELWQFNVRTRRWRRLPIFGNAPDQLASHTAAVVQIGTRTKMLVYGGTGSPFGQTASNSIYLCDLNTFYWEMMDVAAEPNPLNGQPPAEQYPTPLYGQAIALGNDDPGDDPAFYTVGGTSGYHYFMDVHRLGLASKKWELTYRGTSDMDELYARTQPNPRYRHELCYLKRWLIVLGGGTSFHSDKFTRIHMFHVDRRKWRVAKTKGDPTLPIKESIQEQYPPARRCHSAVQLGYYVYILGGYNGETIFPGLWRLNLHSMQWRKLPFDLPKPVYFHASTVSPEGKLYTFGGVSDIEQNTRSKSVYSCWTRVCSLREMCWEALNHYYPDMDERPAESLLQEGIPQDLINTLHGEADVVG